MKLADMTFEDSRIAELAIIPLAEKIMEDGKTSSVFDESFGGVSVGEYLLMDDGEEKSKLLSEALVRRVSSAQELSRRLIHNHYEETCKIIAALNKTKSEDIKQWKRGEVNAQLNDIMEDGDLQSFFMSPKSLTAAALSAT